MAQHPLTYLKFIASLFLFLFAISPLVETYVSVDAATLLLIFCTALFVTRITAFIIKFKKKFLTYLLEHSIFDYVDIGISALGIIIGYLYDSNIYKFWIFILVMCVVNTIISGSSIRKCL